MELSYRPGAKMARNLYSDWGGSRTRPVAGTSEETVERASLHPPHSRKAWRRAAEQGWCSSIRTAAEVRRFRWYCLQLPSRRSHSPLEYSSSRDRLKSCPVDRWICPASTLCQAAGQTCFSEEPACW